MVGAWANGGKYYVTLEITQTANDGKTFTATVDEATDYGDSAMEEETPAPAPAPAKKSPAKVTVNAKPSTTTY